MEKSDLLTLIEYHQWANNRIMRRAAHLSPSQLSEPCWLSKGNLWQTLVHLLDVQWFWRLVCQTGTLQKAEITADQFNNIKHFRTSWQEEDAALLAYVHSLSDDALNQSFEYHWQGARPRSRILWQIIWHIMNHGSHHRSEVGQYLATLGRSPGDMDFVIFVSRRK